MKILTGIKILLFLLLITVLTGTVAYSKNFYDLVFISGFISGFIIGVVCVLIWDEYI